MSATDRSVSWPQPGQIHVWYCRQDSATEPAADTLDAAEREQAGRFRNRHDARRHMATHGALRRILAAYLGLDPAAVPITRSAAGKPRLGLSGAEPGLTFNLSHSADLAAVAVAAGAEIGVDIEEKRPLADLDGVARLVFTEAECAALDSLPQSRRLDAFYECWTRKEALLKAMGSGLLRDPREVGLGFGEGGKMEFRDADSSLWSIAPLAPPEGMGGAVAIQGRLLGVLQFDGAPGK